MKKLIPAIALLLVSAVLMGTSTFAWFSMNTTVTATNMQVEVKSNNTFLLINSGDNDTAAEIQTAGVTTISLEVTDLQASVFPSKPKESGEIAASVDVSTGKYFASASNTAVTDYDSAAVAANWYTAQSSDPTAATTNATIKNINSLDTSGGAYDFSKYVIKRTAYLTLAVGSDDANNLTVTGTILPKGLTKVAAAGTAESGKTYYSYAAGVYTNINAEAGVTAITTDNYVLNSAGGDATINIKAVKVLVVTDDDNMVTLDYTTTTAQSLHETANTTLTDSSVVTVAIYIYYDGSDSSVYTNNIANLGNATIELAFDVEVATA